VTVLSSLTEKLRAASPLTAQDISAACDALFDENLSLDERADFLLALHRKGETPAEIAAFVQVLLTRAVPADLGPGLLDVCGTGGDRAGLFNVSTAVMFVAAACGARVVKHGNRGITSKSGGADVLESLGVRLDLPPAEALDAAGCTFLFAPFHHPSFKAVAPVRKALAEKGSSSIFNMLGPLLNPARPDFQLAGVFNPAFLPAYAEVFALLGRKRAWAAHGAGALDEISTLGPTQIHSLENGTIRHWLLDPAELGIPAATREELMGGTAEENAALLEDLLAGRLAGPKRDIVALNSACALVVAGRAASLSEAVTRASTALASGAAAEPLRALQTLSGARG
jgi:anthranilate phosphoribosyltransferase